MEIGIGIWAFLAYIGFILIWNLVVKRKLAEAMMISWIIVCLLHGLDKAPAALWSSFREAPVRLPVCRLFCL